MSQPKRQISKNEAVEKLWRSGILHWKLDSCQKQLYHTFHNSKYRKVVWKCSRRLGKSFALLIVAVEYALKHPGAQIKYACPTAIMAQKIIIPTIRKILEDCPVDIKPNFVKAEKCFYFANDSIMQIEGVDEGNAEKLRGTESHLSILDEAGFMDDLEYVINDILLPQCLTTNGKILMSSTPSKEHNHPFDKFALEAELNGAYIKKTILDALEDIKNDPDHFKKRLNPEIIKEIMMSQGGENSVSWRREFLVENIIDQEKTVLPEFTDIIEKAIVKEWPRPKMFDGYTAMDLGFVDFTGILFAYYDFVNNKIVIEDEAIMSGREVTTKNIADTCRLMEAKYWIDPLTGFAKPSYLRVSDDDLITINDLYRLHSMQFIPTKKDDKETAVNEVRMKLQSEQIIINPRCKNLIFQIKTATWAKNRRSFERTEQGGHFDLVDALIYLVRNIQYYKNPYPITDNETPFGMHSRGVKTLTDTAQAIKSLFSIKTNK
jgi:hypothetical protein